MSRDEDKIQRDAMLFPFRWKDSLLELGNDNLRTMLSAIFEYGRDGKVPVFNGAMSALWREYQDRLDSDREKYENICSKNRENGKKGAKYGYLGGRPPKNPEKPRKTPDGDFKTPKTPEGEGEGDLKERTLKSSKEKTEPFSLTTDQPLKIPFTKWNEQQFRDEVAKFPEYEDIQEAFIDYWTEPTAKGKMRFQKETAWDTCRRLKTWKQRQQESSMFQTAEERSENNELPKAF